jgi:hypothetical protein
VRENQIDVVLLEKPCVTGLETLAKIKEVNSSVAVVSLQE